MAGLPRGKPETPDGIGRLFLYCYAEEITSIQATNLNGHFSDLGFVQHCFLLQSH